MEINIITYTKKNRLGLAKWQIVVAKPVVKPVIKDWELYLCSPIVSWSEISGEQ